MEKDPRQLFMDLNKRMADGETIHDADLIDVESFDAGDARQRFIRDSQLLAEGKTQADIRKIHEDEHPQAPLDHRQRFIRDSQRLAAGESIVKVAKEAKAYARKHVRVDALRFATDGKLNLRLIDDEDEDEKDFRAVMLKRLAAMAI